MQFALDILSERNAAAPEVWSRQAASASYYALFHGFAAAGAKSFASAGPAATAQVARAYGHADMLRACRRYAQQGSRQAEGAPSALAAIADAFVRLQEARHRADYDIAANFTRQEAIELFRLAWTALVALERIEAEQETQAFLISLLLGDRLTRRS